MSESQRLRSIPSVSEVLESVLKQSWSGEFSREQWTRAVRDELAEIRKQLLRQEPIELAGLISGIRIRVQAAHILSLKTVINATGIIVHTNLGRAPLSKEAAMHATEIAGGYSNLEFDLSAGRRGTRDTHGESFLARLLPAEASLVVNNNAAALLLLLNTFAEGKEVLVSRGELVEIGGSFRLPEIMKKSGASLKEVGSTNKTRLEDYSNAITDRTGMILVVHPSNYQIVGFTEKPALQELVALGKETAVPIVEDHGSGILLDLKPFGISAEPTIESRLNEGIDLICFSGDKILGGPQAGIICGKKGPVALLRKNPLFRALRVDKMVYAALEATLLLYLKGRHEGIPVIAMLSQSADQLKQRAEAWLPDLQSAFPHQSWRVEATINYVGGGVAPMKGLPSFAVSLTPRTSTDEIARRLRTSDLPVVARVEEDRIYFELRTLTNADQKQITSTLENIID